MASKKKQFDLSHLAVHPSLQETELASFWQRAFAFVLDWLIVGIASRFSWAVVILVLLFWLFKRKLPSRIRLIKLFINKNFKLLNDELAKKEIDESLRQNFLLYLQIYLYALIFLFLFVSFGVALGILIGAFYADEFGIIRLVSDDEFLFFKPIQNMANIFDFLGSAVGAILYFSLFTWHWKGQTIGKRLMGLRVVKLNGKDLSLWNSFERMSGYVSSASLLLSGFFQYFWDKNHQTTHDKLCETVVIKADSLLKIISEVENTLENQENNLE